MTTDVSREWSAHSKVMTAISILQMKVLASDSATDGKATWGGMYMPDSCLDHAIQMLIEVLEVVEGK